MSEVVRLSNTGSKVIILSSKEFSKTWTPPTFLVDGVFQERYIYALTASAGTGKTAIALTLAAHTALGMPLGPREVKKGRVLYFAGENPDDILTRWLLLAEAMGFDAADIDVDFIVGAFPIETLFLEVQKAAKAHGPYALVIVDTSAAYFSGEDDNRNVEMQHHAATLRRLTTLPGGPCVIVCCHPPRSGNQQEPRGGSAFLNEIDGNTYLGRKGNVVCLKRHQKFRGPEFPPLRFELISVISSKLLDAHKRPITGVRAIASANNNNQEKPDLSEAILRALEENPDGSIRDIALAVGLPEPEQAGKSKVYRELLKLKAEGFAQPGSRGHWRLTDRGEETMQMLSPRTIERPFAA